MSNEIVLSTSDMIEIISIICTSLLSIIAIIISVLTLIQNNKMIEESSRPYIAISKHVVAINTPKEYLILKNYGSAGAEIIDIKCSIPSENLLKEITDDRDPFSYLIGTFIAPNQTFSPVISTKNIQEENISFTITYKSGVKTYTTVSNIKVQQEHGILYSKSCTNGKELDTISRTLQEMIIQNF